MNTAHFHTGIEEEDAAGQYQVVEIRQVGEEALRHIHVVMAAGRNVNDAQKNEQTCRYDRTDHTSHLLILPTQSMPFRETSVATQ